MSTTEPVIASKLLDEVAERFSAEARSLGRAIMTDAPPDLRVDGNPHWLDLALSNLVSNALRYGEGTITLRATQDVSRTWLSVIDEGPGFTAEFRAKAFDRFSRADSSRTTGGTGLGLALVQAVAEAHHGIAVITPTDSCVSLYIPTKAVPSSEPA
ncbi:MAG TPA: HAMP domain-containing sensor histidine kinase [Nocardioidaceae bacterium]|nr:HAMP domain-containing sensor histidine kinase [Nocardioidaceae bacterium]